MTTPSRLTCIVPTVGASLHLQSCIQALLQDGVGEIVLATARGTDLSRWQIPEKVEVLTVDEQSGFTGACNSALQVTRGSCVAIVNDDAIVKPGWRSALLSALEDQPQLAAAQGVNLQDRSPERIDGCGLAWNRRWQAVQIDRNRASSSPNEDREIFGVSCTAAIFRRSALDATVLETGQYFDSGLGSYYEDVDLACRLRAAGYRAQCVTEARVRHVGAASSTSNTSWRWGQIYGNRLLVLARVLGRAFPPRLPVFLGRDLLDFATAISRFETERVSGILRGWGRAARLLPIYLHSGQPLLPVNQLRGDRELTAASAEST